MEHKTRITFDDMDGVLYPVNGKKEKIMIVISGSEGGLEHSGKVAEYLAEHGIPAFALALFKTRHTGKSLDRIPVERVGRTIAWLKKQGYQKFGIEGVSKGTEYAMAAAIQYHELSCVILKTPSWYYSEGLEQKQPSGHSCWTLDGREIEYTPYKIRHFHMIKMLWETKEFNILPVNTGKEIVASSIIQIEKIHAPILIFSTKADTVWPSYESGLKLCERLQKAQYPYPYKHVSFEHMSHMMLENCGKEIKYFFKSEKENPQACFDERNEMGRMCVEWINDVWSRH